MTEQPRPAQSPAAAQLKQVLKDRMNQGVGLAAKAAGQQAGMLAQAVRQAGEEMRQQGQQNQGKVADGVAQPVQRLSGNLSQADPQQLTSNVKQLKPKLTQQAERLKVRAADQIKKQTGTRASQAGQGVTALTQGVRQTGQQLRAQGQEVPALVLDALAEKVEPLGGYLIAADADRLRSDMAAYGRQAKTKLSSATSTVSRRQQAATTKGTQALKQTASAVRRRPMLPVVGLVVGSILAARKRSKGGQPQVPLAQSSDPNRGAVEGGAESDLRNLSRAELQQRAAAAGVSTDPNMTKNQLIEALRTG